MQLNTPGMMLIMISLVGFSHVAQQQVNLAFKLKITSSP
jgi:hypothetical protein